MKKLLPVLGLDIPDLSGQIPHIAPVEQVYPTGIPNDTLYDAPVGAVTLYFPSAPIVPLLDPTVTVPPPLHGVACEQVLLGSLYTVPAIWLSSMVNLQTELVDVACPLFATTFQ
jgi:hypothetical protein